MSDRATDTRPPIILIDDAVVSDYDLTPYEGWLYVVIVKHANRKTKEAFPGLARLAKLAKMSKSQVMRAIATLEEKKLIRVERDEKPLKDEKRQRSVNHYFVLPVPNSRQEVGVVSGGNYPSGSQEVGVVSGSDKNQESYKPKPLNQFYAQLDIQKQADEVIAKVPPKNINDEQASVLLLSSYLDATQSVDTNMLRKDDRKAEALRLLDKGMTSEHIAVFIKRNKTEEGYWHSKNVPWSILIKDIVSHFEIRPLQEIPKAKATTPIIQPVPELTQAEREELALAIRNIRPEWEKVGAR